MAELLDYDLKAIVPLGSHIRNQHSHARAQGRLIVFQNRGKGMVQLPPSELADRLGALGVREHERNIANKLSRGSFTAVFFIQWMDAIGCRAIHLGDDG